MPKPEAGVYPKKFEKWVRIRDGTRVFLRPIKPSDAEMWVGLHNSLSSMSKYYRFFTSKREPSQKMIKKYTDIDYINNFAIVAVLEEEEGSEKMVGVARYVLDPPPDEAELAVVVADSMQGKGLGTKILIHLLSIMIKRKIKRVHGDIFLENKKMLQLMGESGFDQIKDDAFGVRHFKLKLQ